MGWLMNFIYGRIIILVIIILYILIRIAKPDVAFQIQSIEVCIYEAIEIIGIMINVNALTYTMDDFLFALPLYLLSVLPILGAVTAINKKSRFLHIISIVALIFNQLILTGMVYVKPGITKIWFTVLWIFMADYIVNAVKIWLKEDIKDKT